MPSSQISQKKSKILWSILWIAFIIIASVIVVGFSLLRPVDVTDQKTVTFVIPKGQSSQQIAQRLRQTGLIRSGLAFRAVVYQKGLQSKIQAGSFKLSPSFSTWELAQALTKGTDDLWITLPEGWRREEIADSLSKQDLSAFNKRDFSDLTNGLEGQLFPDTYLVSKSISTQALVNLLHSTFENKVLLVLSDEINKNDLSLNQILTLASLVQRESASEAEMPLIAGILLNRLNLGMPLQVDATLQYIKAYSSAEQSWWPTPLAADKNLDSSFNTYQNSGLPPSPICNPGLTAIKAVLKPQPSNAFYYIHDLSGKIHTAETLEGHNANVNQYLR
jgi:UPF0755 protein